jgi:RHS repeat-associated protein
VIALKFAKMAAALAVSLGLFWVFGPGLGHAADNSIAVDAVTVSVRAAHFAEPLVRTNPTTASEDQALAAALAAYTKRTDPTDLNSLTSYVSAHPNSGWAPSIQTNLGLAYLHDGYFTKAIAAWREAWRLGKAASDPAAKRMVDRAIGELARLYSDFGQQKELSALFDEIGNRPISGSATEAVQGAREALVRNNKDPWHQFNCGPVGLNFLILALDPKDQRGEFLPYYRVGSNGTNLAELGKLADQAKFAHRLVFRKPGQAMPQRALVHWKVGHYSTIVGAANGRYHLRDQVFPGGELWVTQAALDSEASGYFLVPTDTPLDADWRIVDSKEAAKVWGKGGTTGTSPGQVNGGPTANNQGGGPHGGPNGNPNWRQPNGPGGPKNEPGNNGNNNCKLCVYDVVQSNVSVTLSDTPVGYSAPIGPSTTVTITYNQREDSQPANFNFFNVSSKWTINWLDFVVDDPTNPGASVSRYMPQGGASYYAGYNAGSGQFVAQDDDGSILVRVAGSPATYRRQKGDGSVEIYAQSDGSVTYPRKVFLSQVIDPQGNAVTLSYDSQIRLTSLTDAVGRQTTFSYTSSVSPLLVTRITDPFGRYASLSYDTLGRLNSITDVIGLTSSFGYDANSLVNTLTTPYGVTNFAYTAPGTSGPPRFVQVTDPLGFNERLEWLEPAPIPDSDPTGTVPQGMPVTLVNQYLTFRDTFYWNKDAYVAAGCTPTGGCDYSKAVDTHFNHDSANINYKSNSTESIKYPLENRVWYNYPGQTNSILTGAITQRTAEGRVLDDGSTQLYRYAYDATGYYNLVQAVDPVGRTTTYTYANQIDLAAIAQTTAFGVQTTLAQFTYNIHHRPVLATDAAGQTTSFSYNSVQQLASVTNPLSQTTAYHYNPTGDLTSIVNANNVTAVTYTYDAFDRPLTYTDSEGWTATYSYDAADRPTQVAYPDGTSELYTYEKLDLATYQDRLGRKWAYGHDADRRLTSVTDPTGGQTLLAYNRTDEVTSRTDPNSHATQWAYDVQGRLTTKTYADSTTQTFGYETTTSRLKSMTDALSQTKTLGYAQDNRLTSIAYSGAVNPTPNVAYAYDPFFPRVTSRTDGTGTTQFTYIAVGSLGALHTAQEIKPLTNATVTYAYDELGRTKARTVQGSAAETLAYDTIGRPQSDTNDLGAFTFAYLGQTPQMTNRQLGGSNLATTWTYLTNTGDRRLQSVSTTGLSAGQFSSFQYNSNAENQATGVIETADVSVSYPPGALAQTASYNTLNQLTNLSGQTLSWDANGNLLSDGTRTYSWDAENRLVGISYPGQPGKATAFTYDGLGRRVSINSTPVGGGSANVVSYLWCGQSLCQARDPGGSITRAYYTEGEYAPGLGSPALYYGHDRTGSVRRVFTASQAPAYDYDPYGNALQGTAQLSDFGYAGMLYNVDSGLSLATHRPYDPTQGRWLSRDPIGEDGDLSGNLYVYANGNPVDNRDPSGLWSLSFDFYEGAGGGFTVGYDPSPGGGLFTSARVGVGEGGGFDIDPTGTAPGRWRCPPGTKYGGVDAFLGAAVHAGPLNIEGDARVGANADSNGPTGYNTVTPPHVTATPHFGVQGQVAAGVEATAFWFN